jgi:WD40 repeat protein
MLVFLTRSQSRSRSKPVIVWLSVVVVLGLLTIRSHAEGPEPRTWTLSDAHTQQIAYVAFSPDNTMIASSSQDGMIRLWDLSSGRVRFTLDTHLENMSSPVAFSPDGKTLASRNGVAPKSGGAKPGPVDTGGITLWDMSTGRRRASLDVPRAYVLSLSYSPDGQTLAWTDWEAVARLWDVPRNRFRSVMKLPSRTAAIAPNFKTVAVAGPKNTIRLMDLASGQEQAVLGGHKNPISSLAFSPDGQTLATGDHAMWQTGGVSLRDAATGRERVRFKQFEFVGTDSQLKDVNALAYSPDGKILASAGYSTIRLSDAATGKELAGLKTGVYSLLRDLAFSPDGKTLASSSGYVVQFWDVEAALSQAVKKSH